MLVGLDTRNVNVVKAEKLPPANIAQPPVLSGQNGSPGSTYRTNLGFINLQLINIIQTLKTPLESAGVIRLLERLISDGSVDSIKKLSREYKITKIIHGFTRTYDMRNLEKVNSLTYSNDLFLNFANVSFAFNKLITNG